MKVHHGCPVQATINVLSGKGKSRRSGAFLLARTARELRNLSEGSAKRFSPRSSVNWKRMASSLERQCAPLRRRSLTRSAPPADISPLLEDLCDWGSKQFGIKPNLPRNPRQEKLCRAGFFLPKCFRSPVPLGRHLSFSVLLSLRSVRQQPAATRK